MKKTGITLLLIVLCISFAVHVPAVIASPEQETPWYIQQIHADNVSEKAGMGLGIDVAVVDFDGIDKDHEDLANNVKGGISFNPEEEWWYVDGAHHTWCAGIIGAEDNDIGIIGVAPKVSLWSVKIDVSDDSTMADAINWCCTHGIEVISMSTRILDNKQEVEQACDQAYDAGVLLVAAAGNHPPCPANDVAEPASFSSVIAVGATDHNNDKCDFSVTGPELELVAPGTDIKSTTPNDGYETHWGTSASCPMVAGLAALIWSSPIDSSYDYDDDGTWDNDEVRKKLQDSAYDLGAAGRDESYGFGLIDGLVATEYLDEEYALTISTSPAGTSYPEDADDWCEDTSGWTITNGTLTTATPGKVGSCYLIAQATTWLPGGYEVDVSRVFEEPISLDSSDRLITWISGYQWAFIDLWAPDNDNRFYIDQGQMPLEFSLMEYPLGPDNVGEGKTWKVIGTPDWNSVTGIRIYHLYDWYEAGTAGIKLDWLHFVKNDGTTDPLPRTYTYSYGSSVTVTAIPDDGYVFDYWLLDEVKYYSNPKTVTMNSDHTLKAYFRMSGSGGCPTLLVYDGTSYVDYGVIDIHNSEGIDVVREVPVQMEDVGLNNHKATFRLREGWEGLKYSESFIDQVKLYAYGEDGKRYLCPLINATHSTLGNVMPQLLLSDDVKVQTLLLETTDLTFIVSCQNVQSYTFIIEGHNAVKIPK